MEPLTVGLLWGASLLLAHVWGRLRVHNQHGVKVDVPEWDKVWVEKRYTEHPQRFLEHLREDLEHLEAQHMAVVVKVTAMGGWRKVFSKEATFSTRYGSVERVLGSLEAALRDDDGGWVNRDKDWKDSDSLCSWTVDVWTGRPPKRAITGHRLKPVVVLGDEERERAQHAAMMEEALREAGQEIEQHVARHVEGVAR